MNMPTFNKQIYWKVGIVPPSIIFILKGGTRMDTDVSLVEKNILIAKKPRIKNFGAFLFESTK